MTTLGKLRLELSCFRSIVNNMTTAEIQEVLRRATEMKEPKYVLEFIEQILDTRNGLL